MWPDGNGEVFFSCPNVKRMRPVFLMKTGRVRRVRGVAYPNDGCCVSQENSGGELDFNTVHVFGN